MNMRIRTIKPELLTTKAVAELSDASWRMLMSLVLVANDHGCGLASPAFLNGLIYWTTPRPLSEIEQALDELAAAGLLHLYEVNDTAYFAIADWKAKDSVMHQRVDKVSKTLRGVPMPPSMLATSELTTGQPSSRLALEAGSDDQAATPMASLDPSLQVVLDHYAARYEQKYARKPADKDPADIEELVASVGADGVMRAIDAMYDSPPEWLKGACTLKTLRKFFDKLVPVAKAQAKRNDAVGRIDPDQMDYSDTRAPWQLPPEEH